MAYRAIEKHCTCRCTPDHLLLHHVTDAFVIHHAYFILGFRPFTFPLLVRYGVPSRWITMVLHTDIDLLNPPAELEKSKHKLKRLVQSPNSYFMDVKCQGCFNITTVFSHSQSVVLCASCSTVLCTPTGGRARLTEGCSFRRKAD